MKNNINTFGWVDFNKKDRDIALKIIDDNKTQGSIDELGLGAIRDAFSDIFFPGITTIQTRARYFLLVPYWMKIVADKKNTPAEYQEAYLDREKNDSKTIFEYCDKREGLGIFGPDVFGTKRWLVRSIQETYWSGIWRFGLIKNNRGPNRISISSCARLLMKQKKSLFQEETTDDIYNTSGNRDDETKRDIISISNELFDIENELFKSKKYDIKLSKEEAKFLQRTIIENTNGSLLAEAVKDDSSFYAIDSFEKIDEKQYAFIEKQLLMAKEYTKLTTFLGKRFNRLINRKADGCDFFPNINKNLIESIFDLENISHRKKLQEFVITATDFVNSKDGDKLDALICKREKSLKGNRAKTSLLRAGDSVISDETPVSFEYNYRLDRVQQLVKDIREGLGL